MEEAKIYQLKITLKEIRPPIWRRIQIPSNWNIEALHLAIQLAMGWRNCHLYYFEALNQKKNKKEKIDPYNNMFDGVPSNKVTIGDYLSKPNDKMYYEYDMGDSWVHLVTLEKIVPEDKQMKYPVCLDGKRACPPEDCGSTEGYEHILEVLSNPNHREYQELKSWVQNTTGSSTFMPEHFDPKNVYKNWKVDEPWFLVKAD